MAIAARLGHADEKGWTRWFDRRRESRPRSAPSAPQNAAALEQYVMGLAMSARHLVALPGDTVRRKTRAEAT